MKKAIVFANGDRAGFSRILAYVDARTLLIGCDGGAEHMLSLGLTPDVVIGDFDSISRRALQTLKQKHVAMLQYPRDKTRTDSELGIALAAERGCNEIILTGVRGTHTDHVLGNLFLLVHTEFARLSLKIIEGNEEIILVRKSVRIRGKKKDGVSLLPLYGGAQGVTTKGLFYPLRGAALSEGSTRSLRNYMTGMNAEIRIQKGALLLVHRFQ